MKTVSDVARLAGVTVRTLHHYDAIGLLVPCGRSEAGYRLYSHEDLVWLQEILAWRRLGFPLTRVGELMNNPDHDRRGALSEQRRLVGEQVEQLQAMSRALDGALAAHDHGTHQKEDTMFAGLAADQYVEEARERWGETDAFAESQQRTAAYGETEWRTIRREAEVISHEFEALHAARMDAGDEQARAVAERHREHISRWFYDCSPELHGGLGDMYVADARFARNWNERSDGLACYVRGDSRELRRAARAVEHTRVTRQRLRPACRGADLSCALGAASRWAGEDPPAQRHPAQGTTPKR